MNALIKIRNNITSEVKTIKENLILDKNNNLFIYGWVEGNFRCDCNRDICFNKIPNDQDTDDCGYDLYSIEIIDNRTGLVVYSELT